MRCDKCQAEGNDGRHQCPQCGATQQQIEVLSPEERENFQGLTIDSSSGEQRRQNDSEDGYYNPENDVYVRRVEFGNANGSWLNRLCIGLIIIIILFLAFPVFTFVLIALVIGGFLSLFLRRR